MFEAALEAGAEDVSTQGDEYEVITAVEEFADVLEALQAKGFNENSSEITRIPDVNISLEPEKTAKALRLIEKIDDLDDVQSVSTNLDIPDDFNPDDYV